MNDLTRTQKTGLAFCILSPIVGLAGTIWQIYASFAAMKINESAGIEAVGDGIRNALFFSAGGIIGAIVGGILVFVGRPKQGPY